MEYLLIALIFFIGMSSSDKFKDKDVESRIISALLWPLVLVLLLCGEY